MHCFTMYDSNAITQMKVQCSLIWELILHELKLDYNTAETTKSICQVKVEGDHC